MKANVTLKLDTALLREIRILAAEQGSSISALLAAKLEEIVHERHRLREGFDLGWTPPTSRAELHER